MSCRDKERAFKFVDNCIKSKEIFLNLFSSVPKLLITLFVKPFSSRNKKTSRKHFKPRSRIIKSSFLSLYFY